jgi:maleate isomerase
MVESNSEGKNMSIFDTAIKNEGKFKGYPVWRYRVGLIVPSTNTVCEVDFHRLAPEGVSIHTGRMMILGDINGPLDWKKPMNWDEIHQRMHEKCEEVAREVATARVDVMVFGCTSGSFIKGPGFDRQLSQKIEEAVLPLCGRIPVITTSTAVLEAFRELKMRSVSVATPYIDKGNEQERMFLEGNGFRVVDISGLGIEAFGEFARQEPRIIYDLAKKADDRGADGVFISCTDFRALDVIEILEEELGKPVVSSNQASLWLTLKKLKIKAPIKGYGMLLAGSYK